MEYSTLVTSTVCTDVTDFSGSVSSTYGPKIVSVQSLRSDAFPEVNITSKCENVNVNQPIDPSKGYHNSSSDCVDSDYSLNDSGNLIIDETEKEVIVGDSPIKPTTNGLGSMYFDSSNGTRSNSHDLSSSSELSPNKSDKYSFGTAGSSFGLLYNDHNYALPACEEPFRSVLKSSSVSRELCSPTPSDDSEEKSTTQTSLMDNSLDVLVKVADALAPQDEDIPAPRPVFPVSQSTPPGRESVDVDFTTMVVEEEVVTTAQSMSSAAVPPAKARKTVSLVIANKHLGPGVKYRVPTCSVANSLSTPLDYQDDDSGPPNYHSPQKTFKLGLDKPSGFRPKGLPLGSQLAPLRRYRFSGRPLPVASAVTPTSIHGNGQTARALVRKVPGNGSSAQILLGPSKGLVYAYGAGIIPAKNASVGPIRCICGYTHDDGYMIQCDKCKIWQHVDCLFTDPVSLPSSYLCDQCYPRTVNYNRAVQLQRHKLTQQKQQAALKLQLQQQQQLHPQMQTTSALSLNQHPVFKSQHHNIGQFVSRSGLHNSPRASKRKQDLQSRSAESAEYNEHLSRTPGSPGSASTAGGAHTSPNIPTPSSSNTASELQHNGSFLLRPGGSGGPVSSSLTGSSGAGDMFVVGSPDFNHSVSGLVEIPAGSLTLVSPNSYNMSLSAGGNSISNNSGYNGHHMDNLVSPDPPSPRGAGSSVLLDYEECRDNTCSERLQRVLMERRIAPGVPLREQMFARRSKIVTRDFNRKCLKSSQHLHRFDVVGEYKGYVTLYDDYSNEYDYRRHYNPYVLFYSKLEDLRVCVDARHHGNETRFIRRSCDPNCEVLHSFVNNRLHMLILANEEIPNGTELTLPFDFDYTKCRYQVSCACGQHKTCQVARWYRRQERFQALPGNAPSQFHFRKSLSSQPGSDRKKYPFNGLEYDDADSTGAEGVGSQWRDKQAEIYDFSDDELDRVKKKKKHAEVAEEDDVNCPGDKEVSRRPSSEARQERIRQQFCRKLSGIKVPSGSARGRGRGFKQSKSYTGPSRAAGTGSKTRPTGRALAVAQSNKRRASTAFSKASVDTLSESGDENKPEIATTLAAKTPNRRQSNDAAVVPTKKEEPVIKEEPPIKKTRDEIWMDEVLKRIEKLEKKKEARKTRRDSGKSVDDDKDFKEKGEDVPPKYTSNEKENIVEVDQSIPLVKDTVPANAHPVVEIKVEETSPVRRRSRRRSSVMSQEDKTGKVVDETEEDKLVIKYHKTSIQELQQDIDAVINSFKGDQDTVTEDGVADSKPEEPVAVVSEEDSISKPARTTKTQKTRAKSGGSHHPVQEQSFEEFIQQITTTPTVDSPSSTEKESFTAASPSKEHSVESEEKDEELTASPVKDKNEALDKLEDCHESREERWFRMQLKRIADMEKRQKKKIAAKQEANKESSTHPETEDSLIVPVTVETESVVPVVQQPQHSPVSRQRRNSSRDKCPSPVKSVADTACDQEVSVAAPKEPRSRCSSGRMAEEEHGGLSSTAESSSDSDSAMEEPVEESKTVLAPSEKQLRPTTAHNTRRRNSSSNGSENMVKTRRSNRRPSTPARPKQSSPVAAYEPPERVVRTKKTLLENWKQEECNLIVYKEHMENPMEKFSRSMSSGPGYIPHQQQQAPMCASTPTPLSTPTPTKKRWLSQAILEGEEENDCDISQPGMMAPPTTPMSALFNPKKRLMAQFSVDDSLMMSATPPLCVAQPIFQMESNAMMSPLPSVNDSLGSPTTLSPASKLPPKKATLKKREEERIMMEMRKVRVSLSEYRRRRNTQDSSMDSTCSQLSGVQVFPDVEPRPDEVVPLPAVMEDPQPLQEPVMLEEAEVLDTSKKEEVAVDPGKVEEYCDVEEYGPRTPSEPEDEEEEQPSTQVEEPAASSDRNNGPMTPELDDHEAEEKPVVEAAYTEKVLDCEAVKENGSEEEEKTILDDEDEDVLERLDRLYPDMKVGRDNNDMTTLQNIMKRDEEIRDMQELKTLERQKNKLLHQIRSVERGIPSTTTTAALMSAAAAAGIDLKAIAEAANEQKESVVKPTQTVQPLGHRPSTEGSNDSKTGSPAPSANHTTSPLQASKVSGTAPPLVAGSQRYRMPLSEKAVPALVATVAPLQSGDKLVPSKVSSNLSALDAALKTMNDKLKAQLAQAQQGSKLSATPQPAVASANESLGQGDKPLSQQQTPLSSVAGGAGATQINIKQITALEKQQKALFYQYLCTYKKTLQKACLASSTGPGSTQQPQSATATGHSASNDSATSTAGNGATRPSGPSTSSSRTDRVT